MFVQAAYFVLGGSEITFGKMSNRFARFRESPSDVRAGVYPEDRKIRRTGVYKSCGPL